ncbi:hypothetical protein [Candidatus Cyanaurora vandensis]|uniref:hypothetical protein n=1 Tax=Candidatus Cyanaurora vandensis TaxID=2714958 RepID=UPI00257BB1A5|nr:hypothetical protein [Candidatus Cyanaurora vandensis]
MARYSPSDGKWIVAPNAKNIYDIRQQMGEDSYNLAKSDLQKILCDYFSCGQCDFKLGQTISPIGKTPAGGKVLKVRLGLAGRGKRGGLRLSVVVYCKEKRVVIAEVFKRKEDPSDEEFSLSVSGLD